jgi:hypothetical protein
VLLMTSHRSRNHKKKRLHRTSMTSPQHHCVLSAPLGADGHRATAPPT